MYLRAGGPFSQRLDAAFELLQDLLLQESAGQSYQEKSSRSGGGGADGFAALLPAKAPVCARKNAQSDRLELDFSTPGVVSPRMAVTPQCLQAATGRLNGCRYEVHHDVSEAAATAFRAPDDWVCFPSSSMIEVAGCWRLQHFPTANTAHATPLVQSPVALVCPCFCIRKGPGKQMI